MSGGYYLIIQRVGFRMANNIDFKTILEYYMNEGVMTLEKEQLHNQIMDLVGILAFLERKVPLKIKTIKNRIDDYYNDLNKVKRSIREITMPYEQVRYSEQKIDRLPDQSYFCNIDFAYQNYSKLASFSQLEREGQNFLDYRNQALQEMQLKYLESVGMDKYNKGREDLFSNQDKYLHLNHKKYVALMGVYVEGEDFLWRLHDIKDTFIRKSLPFHRDYFNNIVLPDIKNQHKDPQVHILAAVYQYLSFIDLIDFKQSLYRLPLTKDEDNENIVYCQEGDEKIKFQFSTPKKKQQPLLKVKFDKETSVELTYFWKQSYAQAELAYLDLNLKLREALDNLTPRQIIDTIMDLAEICKIYDKLKKKQDAHLVNLMKDFMYWKVGNYHWYYEKWRQSQINYIQGINGIYLTAIVDYQPVLIRITPNLRYQSKYAHHNFISKLMKGQIDLKVVFIYLDLIRELNRTNNSEGCEMDDFGANQKHVWIDFRQKIVYEQEIIKGVRGQASSEEKSQFTSMSCMVQFDLRFKNVSLYVTTSSHPPKAPILHTSDSHCSTRWKCYIRNHQPEERLSLVEVKKHLDSIKKHFVIKRIYERRLQENNRALFQLNF